MLRFKLSVFLNTISRIQFARSHCSTKEIVMLDEGLVQRLLSLFETEQPPSTYISLLRKMPIMDSVLYIEYTGESSVIKNGRVGTLRSSLGEDYAGVWKKVLMHQFSQLNECDGYIRFTKSSLPKR